MHQPDYSSYDQQSYDLSPVPYVPYEAVPHLSAVSLRGSSASSPQSPLRPEYSDSAVLPVSEQGPVSEKVGVPLRKRSAWKVWVAVLSVLVFLIILSGSGVLFWNYLNRSTPAKTLDAFCTALQQEKYEVAYDLFSKDLQSKVRVDEFAGILAQDKIVSCKHGEAAEASQATTSTTLELVHDSQGVNKDTVTLTKDDQSVWRIDDLTKSA